MTRNEARAKCIEAGTTAILQKRYGLRDIRSNGDIVKITRDEFTAAFDALPLADVRVVPVEATEEMVEAAARDWDGRMSARSSGVWGAMSATGDLTNPPETKPATVPIRKTWRGPGHDINPADLSNPPETKP